MADKIEKAFRLIVSRKPSHDEMTILQQYLDHEMNYFQEKKGKAKLFTSIGEYPQNESLDTVQLASLMQLIHTMYNLEESETKS